MSDLPDWLPELQDLFDRLQDDDFGENDRVRLNELLAAGAEQRQYFITYMDIHSWFAWEGIEKNIPSGEQPWESQAVITETASGATDSKFKDHSLSSTPWPLASSTFSLFGNTAHGAVGYFSQVGPLSYLIAMFIMLVMGVVAWSWKLPGNTQIASSKSGSKSGTGSLFQDGSEGSSLPSPLSPLSSIVGRITGMVDCKWEASLHPSSFILHPSSPVSLGDKFTLASGLMEITYDSGAKVILQGPCTYEVESHTGGYLTVGKLTVRLEKKAESGKRKAEDSNPQSLIPNPSLSTLHSPLFTIKTPTAVVTDLGTEFGVEVWPDRPDNVVVFQGEVRVAICDAQGDAGPTRTLQAGQSAQINDKTAMVIVGNMPDEDAKRFIRTMCAPAALPSVNVAASENLVLWLKADAIKNIEDGAPVGMWPDSSGRHNNMYHATGTLPVYVAGASSGLNNMPVMRFDGTQQFCGVLDANPHTPGVQALNTPFSLFSVVRNTDVGDDSVVRGYFGGGHFRMAFGISRMRDRNPRNSFWTWTPGDMNTYGQADSIDMNWNVHAYTLPTLTHDNWTWYRNGTITGGVGLDSGKPQQYDETVYVGSSGSDDEYWMGDVAELLVYDRVLTELELRRIVAYLAGKYGVCTTSHPPEADKPLKRQLEVKP